MCLQVSNRADRMGLMNAQDNIYLYSATQMSEILQQILSMRPRAVIVDSIQTVYLDDVNGSAGSISQVSSSSHISGLPIEKCRNSLFDDYCKLLLCFFGDRMPFPLPHCKEEVLHHYQLHSTALPTCHSD